MNATMLSSSRTAEGDILRVLDELELLVDHSRHAFGRAWGVDLEAFLSLVSHIRQSLPEEIRRANKVARDSEKIIEHARIEGERIRAEGAEDAERIVAEARRQAERLVRDGNEQVARLVAGHEVLKLAQQEAQALFDRAEEESRRVREGADEYAAQILTELDQVLSRSANHVHRGLEKLGKKPA